MIYLDNGATSLPKPTCVLQAAREASFLGNPSRGGHRMALEGARLLYDTRARLCDHFGAAAPDHICFFSGATEALNRVIKSLVPTGGRIVISTMEHNAVRRPALALSKKGVTVTYFQGYGSEEEIIKSFLRAVAATPSLVVFLHTSNICPQTLPVRKLCEICRKRNILSVVDCAQAAGHVPLDIKNLSADGLCLAGHKGLLGFQGVGVLICSPQLKKALEEADTLVEGGSGFSSLEEGMPAYLPERMEAGTLGLPAIATLSAGISYIECLGYEQIGARMRQLKKMCLEGIGNMSGLRLLGMEGKGTGPILFDSDLFDNSILAEALSDKGVCLREGLHCAPLAHQSIGSGERGGMRVSFSPLNTPSQIEKFLCILQKEYRFLKKT